MKREALFGKQFRAWVKAQPKMRSAAFELKQTTTNSIPFSAVQEHQIDALKAVKTSGLLYKIPDDSRGVKPFDFVFLKTAPAYVVIKYPQGFVVIDVNIFCDEKERSDRKSLTWERSLELAVFRG